MLFAKSIGLSPRQFCIHICISNRSIDSIITDKNLFKSGDKKLIQQNYRYMWDYDQNIQQISEWTFEYKHEHVNIRALLSLFEKSFLEVFPQCIRTDILPIEVDAFQTFEPIVEWIPSNFQSASVVNWYFVWVPIINIQFISE